MMEHHFVHLVMKVFLFLLNQLVNMLANNSDQNIHNPKIDMILYYSMQIQFDFLQLLNEIEYFLNLNIM